MTSIVQSSKRELEPLTREAAFDTVALAATLLFAHGQCSSMAGSICQTMRSKALLPMRSIRLSSSTRRCWRSELDYEWIAPDQSTHIAKAILQDLAANGYSDCEEGPRCLTRAGSVNSTNRSRRLTASGSAPLREAIA